MTKLVEFRSSLPSCNFAFKDGTSAVFTSGRYHTDNLAYIAELTHEVTLRHPHISGGEEIDPAMLDPMAGIRSRLRAEFLAEIAAEQAAALARSNDMGGNQNINQNFGALTSDSSLLSVGSEEIKAGITDNSKTVPVVPVTSLKTSLKVK